MPQVTFSDLIDSRKVIISDFDFFKVGDDAIFVNALGNDGLTTTSAPCDKNLGRGCVEPLGDLNDNGVFGMQWLSFR